MGRNRKGKRRSYPKAKRPADDAPFQPIGFVIDETGAVRMVRIVS